jgi:FtsP/CotA-like multicopper oxidase with cupredoxin domain
LLPAEIPQRERRHPPAASASPQLRIGAVGGKPTAGVLKVVMLGGFQEIEFDFVADNPGMTLFHCHQQLHMDFGFMALFDYA